MGLPKELERYSYGDYLSWPEGERWELVDGVAHEMSSPPSRRHQELVGELLRQVANFFADREGPCRVYVAPFDVKFSPPEDDAAPTILEPDVVVCCDPKKLSPQGMNGPPDLVIEVLSPATAIVDRRRKFDVYERFGVDDALSSYRFPDLTVDLGPVFRDS